MNKNGQKLVDIYSANIEIFEDDQDMVDLFLILLRSECDSHIKIVSHYVMLIQKSVDDIIGDEGIVSLAEMDRIELKDRKIDLIEQMYKAII